MCNLYFEHISICRSHISRGLLKRVFWSISNWLFPHCPTPSRKAEGIFHGISCRILVKFLEVNLTILWVPAWLHPPEFLLSDCSHWASSSLSVMALVFSPSSGSHGSFHCEEASTSSIHPWASPVLFVAVCLHLQMQEEVSLSFFFFNLHSSKLSYPIPWFVFFFLPGLQKTDSLVLAKFLLWAAFLTTQF